MIESVAERRRQWRERVHPKKFTFPRRKPGTIWNWHGATPWCAWPPMILRPRPAMLEDRP